MTKHRHELVRERFPFRLGAVARRMRQVRDARGRHVAWVAETGDPSAEDRADVTRADERPATFDAAAPRAEHRSR